MGYMCEDEAADFQKPPFMNPHVQVHCHNASANTYVALMGDSQADFRYYGPPELYERYVGGSRHLLPTSIMRRTVPKDMHGAHFFMELFSYMQRDYLCAYACDEDLLPRMGSLKACGCSAQGLPGQ